MDHIDRNTLNNRADNLRWMSQQDNYRAYEEEVKKQLELVRMDHAETA